MSKEKSTKNVILYYTRGMHSQEIAARLLMDVSSVTEIINDYEKEAKGIIKNDKQYSFVLDQLHNIIIALQKNIESFLEEKKYMEHNRSYDNLLSAIELYIKALELKEKKKSE